MNFIRTYVEYYIGQSQRHVETRNKSLQNPKQAYDHLLSTTMISIVNRISFTSEGFKCPSQEKFLEYREAAKARIIDDIVRDNQFSSTFVDPKFAEYDKTKNESKYYQFAKSTFDKVNSGELCLKSINDDALLAYNLYRIADRVTEISFVWENESKIVLNEKCKFVQDYHEYFEIKTIETEKKSPEDDDIMEA